MTRRDAPPTGEDLADELTAAARARGVTMNAFVAPLVTSTPTNFIQALRRSRTPLQSTIDRVRACCAGLPVPPPRVSPFKGHRGAKRHEVNDGEKRMSSDEIERRRRLTDRAHAERLPGETLHQAIRRLADCTEGGK